MRLNQQGKVQMTVKEAVEKGAAIFAALEASAKKDRTAAHGLADIYETVRDAGIIGPQECHALKLEARAIADSHEADWWSLHSRLTLRCQALGIDVPPANNPDLPQPMDGGGHR